MYKKPMLSPNKNVVNFEIPSLTHFIRKVKILFADNRYWNYLRKNVFVN